MSKKSGQSLMADLRGFLRETTPEASCPGLFAGLRESVVGPARIFCLGKAAPALARAASRTWPGVPAIVYAASPSGTLPRQYTTLVGSHPIPAEENVRHTREVIRWLSGTPGPLLALVSGGGSSLLVAPREPWRLEEKAALSATLLSAGAAVRDLNVVRARLSEVKAGGLLRHLRPWPAATLIWSDVGPRDARLVGGGPTVPWRRSVTAEEVIRRYGVKLPRPLPDPLPPPGPVPGDSARVLCDAVSLRRRYAERLRASGHAVVEVPVPEGWSAEELAKALARRFSASRSRYPVALVGAGEATVRAERGGRGGRCSHLAAAVALALLRSRTRVAWAFAALATDGVDGSAGGGAWVDSEDAPSERDLEKALADRDTGALWEGTRTAVPREPTGNNLRDVWVLIKC
jgi:glycerate 2-kinase